MSDDSRVEFGYCEAPPKTENTGLSDPFADIRPYRDEEVAAVVTRLLSNAEFLDTLATYRLGRLGSIMPRLVRPLVRFALARALCALSISA